MKTKLHIISKLDKTLFFKSETTALVIVILNLSKLYDLLI